MELVTNGKTIYKEGLINDTSYITNVNITNKFISSNEGYEVDISNDGINVVARDEAGALYGKELVNTLINNNKILRCQNILDYPAHHHRELMIDVARHYFSVSELKKIIDECLTNKINYLHLHLSDNESYRIESKLFPSLNDSEYYTKEEISSLVKYAKEKGVSIIPEVELLGHMNKILSIYPGLKCNNNTLCLGKEFMYEFIYKLVNEVISYFPSKYFHAGIDEVSEKGFMCPSCLEYIRKHKLNNYYELKTSYINYLNKIVNENNRTLIVYNDALKNTNIDENIVVQQWCKIPFNYSLDKEKQKGRMFISSSTITNYFDYPYSIIPLKNTYDFKSDFGKSSLGMSCHLWTEHIVKNDELERALFPRLIAFSQCAWLKDENKDYDKFLENIDFDRLKKRNISFTPLELCDKKDINEVITYFTKLLDYEVKSNVNYLNAIKIYLDLIKSNYNLYEQTKITNEVLKHILAKKR